MTAAEFTTARRVMTAAVGFGDTAPSGSRDHTRGGFGFLVRKYGLTIDALQAADIVTADGEKLRVDADRIQISSGRYAGRRQLRSRDPAFPVPSASGQRDRRRDEMLPATPDIIHRSSSSRRRARRADDHRERNARADGAMGPESITASS